MSLIAAVASCKGGSGKSTTALNLGIALARLGRDVTIIDANLSTPYLSVALGAPKVPVTLHHVLNGEAHIRNAIYQHESGAKIIPGSLSMEHIHTLDLSKLKHHLGHIASDIILLDGAPGLSYEAQSSIQLSHEVLVTTTPDLPSVAQTYRTVKLAQHYHKPITGIVLTRTGHALDLHHTNVQTLLEHPIIGHIPEDPYVKKAVTLRESVVHAYPQSPAARAYQELAKYLTGYYSHGSKDTYSVYRFMRWALGK